MTSLPGLHDSPHFQAILDAQQGVVAYDVGANGGGVACRLAARFSRVVAFEPATESFADLYVRAPGNVTCVPLAVSREDGPISLYETENSIRTGQLVSVPAHLGWGSELARREVTAVALDSCFTLFGTPDFIKIDVEGHELDVFAGAVRLIALHRPNLAIEVHSAEYLQPILNAIRQYDMVQIVRHSGYKRGSAGWNDHFYVHACSA
jgi:FkbM family methyltransferase